MNSAMKALAAERAARNGSALPRQTPKPAPQGLEDLVKPLPPCDASTVHTRILGVAQNILDAPDDMSANGPRVVNKEKFLRALKGARKPEELLKRIGFATRRGADKHGKQVDWLVLDVVNETESAPSDLQKLRRIAKAIQDAERRNAPKARQSRADADAEDRTRILRNMAEDRMDVSTKKPKTTPAAPTPPRQMIVRVRQADGTVRRVAFDDCGPSLDDLRMESGADELFADEACTQPAVQEDLCKHGAIVYARHNDAMADGEGG